MKFTSTALLLGSALLASVNGISHPGINHNLSDLKRIKSNVASRAEPWYGSYAALKIDSMGSKTYTPNPIATIGVSDQQDARTDAAAAYLNALNWYISGDTGYLDKSISIINGYVNTVKSVTGDAQITGYFMGFKLSAAVEVVRLNPSWTPSDQSAWNAWAYSVLYQPICNGGITGTLTGTPGDGNQGAGDLKCVMAIGISTDNTTMYNYATNLFKTNKCFGVTAYIDANGCTGEAGRDMAHPQGALEHFSDMAKMAELQGDTSLWSYGNNRILTAWEWMAKRNLNNGTVPFTNTGTCYTDYTALSLTDLGRLVPSYELPWNYYTSKGLSMPYTAQVIAYHGPETNDPSGDGEDTLYATLAFRLKSNTTAPIVTSGKYNIRPMAQRSLYVGAPSSNADLALATSATQSWIFTHIGNDVYLISPASATGSYWDSGSTSGGAGSVPYSNSGAVGDPWQKWKILRGPSGSVSFTTFSGIQSDLPRVYAFLGTQGGSGTNLIMQSGTSSTTTTNTAQLYILQAAS